MATNKKDRKNNNPNQIKFNSIKDDKYQFDEDYFFKSLSEEAKANGNIKEEWKNENTIDNDYNNKYEYSNENKQNIKELVDETIMTNERLQAGISNYIEKMVKSEIDRQLENVKKNNTLNERVDILFQNAVKNYYENKKKTNNSYIYDNNKNYREVELDGEFVKIAENNDIYLNKKFKIENNLTKFIKAYGFTQSEVADKIGVSSKTLSNIATNKFNTSLDVALKLSTLFHVSVNEIFWIVEEDLET